MGKVPPGMRGPVDDHLHVQRGRLRQNERARPESQVEGPSGRRHRGKRQDGLGPLGPHPPRGWTAPALSEQGDAAVPRPESDDVALGPPDAVARQGRLRLRRPTAGGTPGRRA